MAAVLSVLLFSSQVIGQTLNSQSIAQPASDNSVTTIRLAQNNTGTTQWPAEIEIDIDPPVIDHEALESGVPGQSQQFSALVVDDQGLEHVKLYHRDVSGAQYSSVDMTQTDDSSEFTVTIDTSLGQDRIEYYIEALDVGGNRVLKGFPFFPLVRELDPVPGSTTQVSEEPASDNRLIYVLLGVAAVGLAAALLGGGGDDSSGSPGGGGGDDTVPLNIVVTPP